MPRRSVQPTFEQKAQFGAQLRTWRKMRGLKQKELAKRCGLTQNVISKYELGDQYPTDEIILRLAKELNIAPEALEDRKYTDAPSVRYGSILWRLLTDDWRTSTIDEIAAELGTTSQTVYSRLSDLKRRGYPILFRHTQHGTGKPLDPPIRVPEARQRVNHDHCKNCRYALTDGMAKPSGCLYYAYTGKHRPHPINGQCQVKDTGKRRRNVYKGVV